MSALIRLKVLTGEASSGYPRAIPMTTRNLSGIDAIDLNNSEYQMAAAMMQVPSPFSWARRQIDCTMRPISSRAYSTALARGDTGNNQAGRSEQPGHLLIKCIAGLLIFPGNPQCIQQYFPYFTIPFFQMIRPDFRHGYIGSKSLSTDNFVVVCLSEFLRSIARFTRQDVNARYVFLVIMHFAPYSQ